MTTVNLYGDKTSATLNERAGTYVHGVFATVGNLRSLVDAMVRSWDEHLDEMDAPAARLYGAMSVFREAIAEYDA